jgi:ABC-2 type transport system ATP-binding protein
MNARRKLKMNMIEVVELTRKFGHFTAVDNVSFQVEKGEIFGLLGPNGAGKTTTIRCMLTLIKPSSGTIKVAGFDVSKKAQEARRLCGYVPQEVSVDGDLSGFENLLLYAKLYGVPAHERRKRIAEALDFMQVSDRANSLARTFSGGMMRRLEIGQVLVNRPQVLFLDEPSIGLDPAAKRMIWDYVVRLRDEFHTTILITTHDMLEADELCDRIAIMNGGKIAVTGTPEALKLGLGGDVVEVTCTGDDRELALVQLGYKLLPHTHDSVFDLVAKNGETDIPIILESLRERGVETKSVALKRATLDDVFLKYAGKRIGESDSDWGATRAARRTIKRLG